MTARPPTIRQRLTDKFVEALKPAPHGKRYVIADALVPGFGVRVTERGVRTYFLRAKFPGDQYDTRRKIGVVGAIPLATAREIARKWLELIATGRDPEVVARQEREAAARANTNSFQSVAEAYIRSHQRGKRQMSVVVYRLKREVIPRWRNRNINEISRHDVLALIQAIADRPAPAFARNVFDAIRGVFNWAINRPAYGLEYAPTDRIEPKVVLGPKNVRERVLDDDEIRAVWRAAERCGDRRRREFLRGYPYGSIIQLLLLTGCRVSEVALARWSEFDLKRGMWTIPAARFKMKAVHRVPLTPAMIKLLKALPRWSAGDYLFSLDGRKPFAGFSTSKRLLDRRVERTWRAIGRARGISRHSVSIDPWILHDLRRTVRTRLAALRIPDNISELVIGHAKKGLARVYDQHAYLEEIREALTAWNVALTAIVTPPPDNVIPLKKLGS
jgi:integrase